MMPLYVVQCPKCERREEHLCAYSELSDIRCEVCGTQPDLVIQPVGYIWKCAGYGGDASNVARAEIVKAGIYDPVKKDFK